MDEIVEKQKKIVHFNNIKNLYKLEFYKQCDAHKEA